MKRAIRGFTLLELLVVIGLIAALSFFLMGGLTGGGQVAALQSAQATLANLVTAAGAKAGGTGRKVRLLVNADPTATDHYLRQVVLQSANEAGASPANWETTAEASLPEGVYVVPPSLAQAVGLVATPSDWKRGSDPAADLVSDLFANQTLLAALPGDSSAQAWMGVAFTPNGTLAALDGGVPPKGALLIVPGVRRPPGSYLAGESPVQLVNPSAVRGLVVSAYGVPALLNERAAF